MDFQLSKKTKSIFRFVLLVVVPVILFTILPLIFDVFKNNPIQLTTEKIKKAVFFGTTVPALFFLSPKIKSHFIFILIALAVMTASVFIMKLFF